MTIEHRQDSRGCELPTTPTVYVDQLRRQGFVLWGREIASCHLMVWPWDEDLLHGFAAALGCSRSWYQARSWPCEFQGHYDLTPRLRDRAVTAGAIEIRGAELARVHLAEKRRQIEDALRYELRRLKWTGHERFWDWKGADE